MGTPKLVLLSELPAGSLAIVFRVDGNPELKRKMLEMGLVPGTELLIQQRLP